MKNRNRIIPVLIVLVLIAVIGTVTIKSLISSYEAGTKEMVDYEDTYNLNPNEYAVFLNGIPQSFKAVEDAGQVYIDAESVAAGINSRFYWDSNEKIFIYTTATKIIKAFPNETNYYVDGSPVSLSYEPVKTIGEQIYVAVDYIKEFTQCELEVYTDPNRVAIVTEWDERVVASVSEPTVIRYRGGLRSEILREIPAGETVTILQTEDDWSWTNIATKDGYNGWVEKKYLGPSKKETPTAPPFEEEEFTYLKEEGPIIMAWHQMTTVEGGSAAALQSALNNTQGINVISPTWFYFADTEGNLGDIINPDYITYAHNQGLKVWAMFANTIVSGGEANGNQTDKIIGFTSKREQLISQLMEKVLSNGIDGINLDFEMITEEGADNYIQFVRELSVACRKNGIVFSVDNFVPLYSRHYNRAEQAKFADYVVIMGYDEYGSWSAEPGPGASLPFVRQGIEDTLEIIGGDSSKVINGIPFYTTVWETGPNNYFAVNTVATMWDVDTYLSKYPTSTVSVYNEELGYDYAYYTSPLNGYTYRLWVENVTSIEQKMKLVQEFQLAGVACWKLQQEKADVWPVINSYLNY